MKILASWIGTNDLNAAEGRDGAGLGAIAGVLRTDRYERVVLLANQEAVRVRRYADWLEAQAGVPVKVHAVDLPDPTDFEAIVAAVAAAIDAENSAVPDVPAWTYNFSSGTPAMAMVWGILSLTRYPGRLAQSSAAFGARIVNIPFALSAEFMPAAEMEMLAVQFPAAPVLKSSALAGFEFRNAAMVRLMRRMERAILRSFPVVIEGEPGTEKEFLVRLIHENGPRAPHRLVTLDCAALQPDDIDAAIFGSVDQNGDRVGDVCAWVRAGGGMLFIDNAERLSQSSQLLLQKLVAAEARLDPALAALARHDVRVIVASAVPLMAEVAAGRFLESCFYTLAQMVLKIPPLRERRGDLSALIDWLLQRVLASHGGDADARRLTPGARNVLLQHAWPGNLRELESTLRRAVNVAQGPRLTEADVLDALMPVSGMRKDHGDIMNQPVEAGVDLQAIMATVARSYLKRALEIAEGSKSEAARLLNMPSYQTLSNWMKKYEVD